MDILTRDFYARDTLAVARDLLGREIVRVLEGGTAVRCRITETEAYIGRLDKACHAYGYRRTSRRDPFRPAWNSLPLSDLWHVPLPQLRH